MRVARLSLRDFRNYPTAEVEFSAGPNLIIGPNGQGKTNLIEAIAYFSGLRSHRVSSDAPLVRAGASAAIARMRLEAAGRDVLLELQINREGANKAQVNRNSVRPREVTRWFSSVSFVPEDLTIVRGEPSGRRRFLDEALVSRHPIASGVLSDYERVVRQRTSLLKSARSGSARAVEATLPVWDEQLIETGTQIMLARRELIRDLSGPLRDGYRALVDADHLPGLSLSESVCTALDADVSRETLTLEDLASVSRETLAHDFRAALAEVRGRELERGVTLVGPHRDDLELTLNALPVKGYASHGESWSFALSLKMALAALLSEESPAGDPVIILDDVFAELDLGRRGRLMSAVSGYEQVIVTAAVEEDIPEGPSWRRIAIAAGEIVSDSGPSNDALTWDSQPTRAAQAEAPQGDTLVEARPGQSDMATSSQSPGARAAEGDGERSDGVSRETQAGREEDHSGESGLGDADVAASTEGDESLSPDVDPDSSSLGVAGVRPGPGEKLGMSPIPSNTHSEHVSRETMLRDATAVDAGDHASESDAAEAGSAPSPEQEEGRQ
ncbi:DNA replication/repair protein RecF [Leucobacter sp. CSA2]|uniref:DNA replication and repair protein RecF n=1 Tax=Leucobacter edaphi TaxID=2796472 RepID=A0A934QEY3_9MICO|nr:DNA replication/repair protein RecF [Leucobacter edaphi]